MFLYLILTLLLSLYAYTRFNRIRKYADKIPGDKPWPVLGNILELGTDITNLIPSLMKYLRKHNNCLFGLWIGFDYFVILSQPDDVEVVLGNSTNLSKTKEYCFVESWIGKGLITSTGDEWRRNRKIITPTFHIKMMKEYVKVMNSCIDTFLINVHNYADGRMIDIFDKVSLCALDIVIESGMGIKINAQNQPNSMEALSILDMCYCAKQRAFSIWKRFDLLYRFSNTYRVEQKALKVFTTFNEKVITERAKILREKMTFNDEILTNLDDNDDNIDSTKKPIAFLDNLLTITDNGQNLPDKMIKDEVATFICAGHETTTSAMAFSLYCLANYPDVQKKALQEQIEILGYNKNVHSSLNNLQNMIYLDYVIKEVLRLYPSGPYIARKIEVDTVIDGKVIPAGTNALIFIYAMNNNPKYFPNPEIFDPERFLPENRINKHPYDYIPFSAGPRNCIGQKFAIMAIKTMLSKVLRNFELFSAAPENAVQIFDEVALKSLNGVRIRLKPRNYSNIKEQSELTV